MNNYQYTIKSDEQNYIVNFTTILNNSQYCVALSKSINTKKKSIYSSKISFMKYKTESFISQETISEDLIYCCYNPKNTIELVLCGKGYLRLWNIFVNEGILKEHQQRFLRGKQEKEKTFIKAQFFEKKPFLLIVGTLENTFFIIDNFQLIHELNVNYSIDNIYDLNLQNIRNDNEDDEEAIKIKEKIDALNTGNIDTKIREIIALSNEVNDDYEIEESSEKKRSNNPSKTNYNSIFNYGNTTNFNKELAKTSKEEVFQRLYNTKKKEIINKK